MRSKVLVVDDCESIREGIVLFLQREGFSAIGASNGAEALQYLESGGRADVILLDLLMPVMDGWTFRRAQLRDPWLADIPVVVMSVLEGRPVTGAYAVEAFRKPTDLKALLKTVGALCARVSPRARKTIPQP